MAYLMVILPCKFSQYPPACFLFCKKLENLALRGRVRRQLMAVKKVLGLSALPSDYTRWCFLLVLRRHHGCHGLLLHY